MDVRRRYQGLFAGRIISVPLSESAERLTHGSLLQFRSRGFVSRAIRYATRSVHSHSAMLAMGQHEWEVLEVRELRGGRTVPLHEAVERNSGRIDVFEISELCADRFDRDGAVREMRTMTEKPYGYISVARIGMASIPLLRRMIRINTNDDHRSRHPPFCSEAVCYACRVGGGCDPVLNRPDSWTTPGDLTRSLLFRYQFTLKG